MKKTLCIVIAIINILLAFTSVNAATITDNAKKDLFDFGIMVGDDNGDLRLNDNITRAEVIKMICVAGNIDTGLIVENAFPDVAKTHWAYKYIGAANFYGIVEGDDKGYFNPETNVTNEEVVKMIVCLLGYEEMAETKSGYPAGYTSVGTQIGLTTDLQLAINTPATRNDVAVMIHKALDIPVMQKIESDDEATLYAIMDGTHGYNRITLRSGFTKYDTSRQNISKLSKKFASQYKYKEGDTEKSFALYPDIIYTAGVDKTDDGMEYECPAIYDDLMVSDLVNNISLTSANLKYNNSTKMYSVNYALFREKILVPANVFKIFGCDVKFDESLYVAEIKDSNVTIEIMSNLIGMRKDKAEGFWIPLEVCARIINNELYVPFEAVAREFGIDVQLDMQNNMMNITK